MTPVGFEPTIPATEGPQTHALVRAATEIGIWVTLVVDIVLAYYNYVGKIVEISLVFIC